MKYKCDLNNSITPIQDGFQLHCSLWAVGLLPLACLHLQSCVQCSLFIVYFELFMTHNLILSNRLHDALTIRSKFEFANHSTANRDRIFPMFDR